MSRFIARHFSAPLNGCFVQCLEEHYISLHQSCQEAYLGFLYEYLWKFQRLLELESSSKEKILSPLHSTDLCVLKLKWIYTRYKLNQLTSLSICWCNDWALQMSTCQSLIVIYVHGSIAELTQGTRAMKLIIIEFMSLHTQCWIRLYWQHYSTESFGSFYCLPSDECVVKGKQVNVYRQRRERESNKFLQNLKLYILINLINIGFICEAFKLQSW